MLFLFYEILFFDYMQAALLFLFFYFSLFLLSSTKIFMNCNILDFSS